MECFNDFNDSDEPEDLTDDKFAKNNLYSHFNEWKRSNDHSKFLASGWADDTEGIEEETDPHKSAQLQMLQAAENGELELVKSLVASDKSLLDCRDNDKYTPLHRAAYNNHLDVLELLLSAGADCKARTIDGWQPLHSACKWNNVFCAAKLLECGADINSQTNGGQTPLHLAASNGQAKETLQLLLLNDKIDPEWVNDAKETAFDVAKRSGKYYRLFELVEPCINII